MQATPTGVVAPRSQRVKPVATLEIPRSVGSNTAADHIAITDAAIAAIPAKWRRNLLITIAGRARATDPAQIDPKQTRRSIGIAIDAVARDVIEQASDRRERSYKPTRRQSAHAFRGRT